MTEEKDHTSRLKAALQVIDLQRKILLESKADDSVIKDLASIVRYLSSMSSSQAAHILEKPHRRSQDQKKSSNDDIVQAYNLSLEDVSRVVSSENVTRAELESIAVGRFQVPKGSLRSIGNIDQLKDKVINLVLNEKSHQTISKLAGEHKYK